MKKIIKSGQSLFEVLFAVAISALILIAVVSLSTQSVKNSDASKNNTIASKYAQEGLEWVRQQRDISWTNLTTQPQNSDITLGSIGIWGSPNPVKLNTVDTIFSRYVHLTPDASPPTSYDVVIKVTWEDSGGEHEVVNSTKLTNWRN